MPVYPLDIADAIREPRYGNTVRDANAVGAEGKFDCGCFVRVEMRIAVDSEICEIGYRTNGCGYMVAAAELLGSNLRGASLADLDGELEGWPNGRSECSDVVVRAIKRAFADRRSRLVAEFRGETPLICTCFGVTEDTIEQFVRQKRTTTLDEVSEALRAGSGCGSCRMLIQEIIDANR